jgi:2-dehydro-3-deoxy-D-gluconate 5-dehydrogenase
MKETLQEMFGLDGKVAIVTGGNRGIGKGIALGLAGAGANIVIGDINIEVEYESGAVNAVTEIKRDFGVEALGLKVDVRREADNIEMVSRTLDRFGRVDILVCNAGMGGGGRLPQDMAVAKWDEILETNLRSVFIAAKAVYPAMKKEGGGKIISIGSMTSIFGVGAFSAYGASKGGVLQLTRSLAMAWARDNIQVNCILPGWINSDLSETAKRNNPELEARVIARTPAGRWGEPADLAGCALFLASRASDFVTGAAIPVDGGYAAQG